MGRTATPPLADRVGAVETDLKEVKDLLGQLLAKLDGTPSKPAAKGRSKKTTAVAPKGASKFSVSELTEKQEVTKKELGTEGHQFLYKSSKYNTTSLWEVTVPADGDTVFCTRVQKATKSKAAVAAWLR